MFEVPLSVVLAAAAVTRVFASGRWLIPIAAWIAPVFALHFMHETRPVTALVTLAALNAGAMVVSYRGIIPAPGLAGPVIAMIMSLPSILAYAAGLFIAERLSGLAAVLVFPAASAAVDFGVGRLSPYGTWGSAAYTQSHNLPLMQLASVTGAPGIVFLMAWLASTTEWIWRHGWGPGAFPVIASFIITALAIMAFGGLRLLRATSGQAIRVAAIGWPEGAMNPMEMLSKKVLKPALAERDSWASTFKAIEDYFFAASEREAEAGARLIIWPEANVPYYEQREPALMKRTEELARNRGIHLLMGLAKISPDQQRPLENRAVLLAPDGVVKSRYAKAIPVPGPEAQLSTAGPRRVGLAETELGRIASVICFDMDFPDFIRQAGKAGADLLLVPASDWEAIKEIHSIHAAVRAVENGVPLLRATRWGFSTAVDAFGRTMARLDPFEAPRQTMVAHLAPGSVPTIYAKFGDWFGWGCCLGLTAASAALLA